MLNKTMVLTASVALSFAGAAFAQSSSMSNMPAGSMSNMPAGEMKKGSMSSKDMASMPGMAKHKMHHHHAGKHHMKPK